VGTGPTLGFEMPSSVSLNLVVWFAEQDTTMLSLGQSQRDVKQRIVNFRELNEPSQQEGQP